MWNIILDFHGRFWCTDAVRGPALAVATAVPLHS